MAFIKIVCPRCGSDHVGVDAPACWDLETQEWVMSWIFDDLSCNECGYDSSEFAEVTPKDGAWIETDVSCELTDEAREVAEVALTEEESTILAARDALTVDGAAPVMAPLARPVEPLPFTARELATIRVALNAFASDLHDSSFRRTLLECPSEGSDVLQAILDGNEVSALADRLEVSL